MSKRKRLDLPVVMIIRGYCLKIPEICERYSTGQATITEIVIRTCILSAADKIMQGEEKMIPEMLRSIAYKIPYEKANTDLVMSMSRKCFYARKQNLMLEMAERLRDSDLLPF